MAETKTTFNGISINTNHHLRERGHNKGQERKQRSCPVESKVIVHCIAVSFNRQLIAYKHRQSSSIEQSCRLAYTRYNAAARRSVLMQSTDGGSFFQNNHKADLLWMPKSGKIPAKEDRVKLLAASALAANVG